MLQIRACCLHGVGRSSQNDGTCLYLHDVLYCFQKMRQREGTQCLDFTVGCCFLGVNARNLHEAGAKCSKGIASAASLAIFSGLRWSPVNPW